MNSFNNSSLLDKVFVSPLTAGYSLSRSSSEASATSAAAKSSLEKDTFAAMPKTSDTRNYPKISRSPSLKSSVGSVQYSFSPTKAVSGAASSVPPSKSIFAGLASWSKNAAAKVVDLSTVAVMSAATLALWIGFALDSLIGALVRLTPGKIVQTDEQGEVWMCQDYIIDKGNNLVSYLDRLADKLRR